MKVFLEHDLEFLHALGDYTSLNAATKPNEAKQLHLSPRARGDDCVLYMNITVWPTNIYSAGQLSEA